VKTGGCVSSFFRSDFGVDQIGTDSATFWGAFSIQKSFEQKETEATTSERPSN
jgi:hypothetical protein